MQEAGKSQVISVCVSNQPFPYFHYFRRSKSSKTLKITVAKNEARLEALALAETEAENRLAEIDISQVSTRRFEFMCQ